jgi:hypothetical protein
MRSVPGSDANFLGAYHNKLLELGTFLWSKQQLITNLWSEKKQEAINSAGERKMQLPKQ